MNLRKVVFGTAVALVCACDAFAQAYPTKTIRIVVPFPAGGGIDVLVRALAAELSMQWKQPIIIDNRAGAGGVIGAAEVARATPDGYTLMATVDQTLSANRYLYNSLPYNPDKSFAPITMMVRSDHLILATPAFPANDLRELVAHAKGHPDQLSYGSFGVGSQPHLLFGYLNKREGLDLVHVPYKGIAPLLTAIIAGEVPLATGSAGVAGGMLKAGRMKALAIAGAKRSAQFPDVPTTAEQGYPYLRASIWYGLFAPAGTPQPVIDKINTDVVKLLRDPAFSEKQATSKGLDVVASTPQELAAMIREEVAATAEMVKAADIKPE
jgi:tripartite-type tricarboxylate transporter receptor subunit TctC